MTTILVEMRSAFCLFWLLIDSYDIFDKLECAKQILYSYKHLHHIFYKVRVITSASLTNPLFSASFCEAIFSAEVDHCGTFPFLNISKIHFLQTLVAYPLPLYSDNVWIPISLTSSDM